MTAEGVFPKVGGDIIYASEVNRFAGAGRFLSAGSFATIGSATASQDIGSIFIGTGSLTNPCSLFCDIFVTHNGRDSLKMTISGTGGNGNITLGSTIDGTSFIHYDILIGSPSTSFIIGKEIKDTLTNISPSVAGNIVYSTNQLTTGNVDPTQNTVVLFSAIASANFTINGYTMQAFRGTI